MLDAIVLELRAGWQWRMIVRDLLPWDAASGWYRASIAEGPWDRVHDALRDQIRICQGRDVAR